MPTITATQAARLLQLHVKRVQALARTGGLPARRVGRKWLFDRGTIERMVGVSARPEGPVLEISARNHLRGEVVLLHVDGLMAEVVVRIGDQQLVSVITRSSAERLRLKEGAPVFAIVKATEVMIGRAESDA
jgi:molybdopterin-binding protein